MSDINFRLGSSKEPKGHAVIYFVEDNNIFVSYVVDFPITVDMSKYIPEMFADQIPEQDMLSLVLRSSKTRLASIMHSRPSFIFFKSTIIPVSSTNPVNIIILACRLF